MRDATSLWLRYGKLGKYKEKVFIWMFYAEGRSTCCFLVLFFNVLFIRRPLLMYERQKDSLIIWVLHK